MRTNRPFLAILSTLAASALTACPKQPPDPVPAGCKPPNHCAGGTAPEGPPPIGGNTPPKT